MFALLFMKTIVPLKTGGNKFPHMVGKKGKNNSDLMHIHLRSVLKFNKCSQWCRLNCIWTRSTISCGATKNASYALGCPCVFLHLIWMWNCQKVFIYSTCPVVTARTAHNCRQQQFAGQKYCLWKLRTTDQKSTMKIKHHNETMIALRAGDAGENNQWQG